MASALTSRLGGFGGFGKKKQQAPPPTQIKTQPSRTGGFHIDGDANHDFEFLVGTRRPFSFRRTGWIQAGAAADRTPTRNPSINVRA